MTPEKATALKEKGWHIGSTDEFLRLNKAESEYIELKMTLGKALARQRKQRHLTQKDFAKLMKTSQSRIARMEKGHPSVSLDIMVRFLLAMDISKSSIGKLMM